MTGKTCAGTLVTGTGVDGRPRRTYLYHVVDNEWSMREYGSQAVVWQTALNPVVALELLAGGEWSGVGVLGPEAFRRSRISTSSPSTARRTASSSSSRRARLPRPPGRGFSRVPSRRLSISRRPVRLPRDEFPPVREVIGSRWTI